MERYVQKGEQNLKQFYVSLVKDLLGCYILFEAESEQAVRQYLLKEYSITNNSITTWKLPWCGIYDKMPERDDIVVLIKARCGPLYEEK